MFVCKYILNKVTILYEVYYINLHKHIYLHIYIKYNLILILIFLIFSTQNYYSKHQISYLL